MEKYLLGIDIGSSSCKLTVLDQSGRFIGAASKEYKPLSPQPGWAEQDPEDWFRAVKIALQKLTKENGIELSSVAAVGSTGQMKGVTFISSDGEPVRNTILWNDLRNVEEVLSLKALHGATLDRISLNPINTTCTLSKALWLERHEPRNWEKTAKIIFPKDFINFRLTGTLQTDLSEASVICFFNHRTQTWWPEEIFRELSFPKSKLPDFFPSTSVIGRVMHAAAKQTGLPAGIPVVAGGSDATIESLAIGQIKPGQCKIGLGTAGALVTLVDSLEQIKRGRYYVLAYLVPGLLMLDNSTRSCAQSTTWFREVFFSQADQSGATYQAIADQAALVDIGSEGLFFHPYLTGEDSPYWDPRLKGSFFGIVATHGWAHFARAVYEGTAYALRDASSGFGKLMETFSEYLIVGGGTKNPVWTSIIVDVLGIEAKIPAHSDASFGAAMLAGIGAGIFGSLEEAVCKCVRFETSISYDKNRHYRYSELFHRYRLIKKIYDQLYVS